MTSTPLDTTTRLVPRPPAGPDRQHPGATVASAWLRTVAALERTAPLVNTIAVDPDEVGLSDRLPHLPLSTALELFCAYAECVQQRDQLAGVPGPEASLRRHELGVSAAAVFAAMLEGHPYSPGWTAGTAANAVRLAELANRYREDARDARLDRDRRVREADQRARHAERRAAELARVVDELTSAARYTPTDAGAELVEHCDQVADVVPLPGSRIWAPIGDDPSVGRYLTAGDGATYGPFPGEGGAL